MTPARCILLLPLLLTGNACTDSPVEPAEPDAAVAADGSPPAPDGGDDPVPEPPPPPAADSPLEVFLAGNQGLYDISLEDDSDQDRVVMSYTGVSEISLGGHRLRTLETRLATSNDDGVTWTDRGVINRGDVAPPLPQEYDGMPAAWVHEVSSIAFNPAAEQQWSLAWHTYLHVDDGGAHGDERKVQYGWLSYKTADSPEELAAAPTRKLIVGAAYELVGDIDYKNAIGGEPELYLQDAAPVLASCVAFTEPGLMASSGTLYMSLVCLEGTGHARVVVLRETGESWEYLGTALASADDSDLAGEHSAFSAPDLFTEGGVVYLMASPQFPQGLYGGCTVFQVEDLASATLVDDDDSGAADVVLHLDGKHDGINPGACSYASGSTGTGITYGEIFGTDSPFARQYRSMVSLAN